MGSRLYWGPNQRREPIKIPVRISVLDEDVLSFYVGKVAQSQPNCRGTSGLISCIARR